VFHGLKEINDTISTRKRKRNIKKRVWNKLIQFLGQETAAMMEITFKAYCINAGFNHLNFLIIWKQFPVSRNQYTDKNINNEILSIKTRHRKPNCFYVCTSEIYCQKYRIQQYRSHQQDHTEYYTKGKKVGRKSYY